MASHAPAHLPTESKSPTLRSLLSFFGDGPGHQKSESVTVEKDDEAILGQLPLLPAGNLFGNVSSAVAQIIWALTKNDLFTSTLPNAIFGITAAIADTHLRGEASEGPTFSEIIARFPLTYFFNFYALLIFNLGNQRPREGSIAEERVNNKKPLPSGKTITTPGQIRRAYLILLPITLAFNHFFGVWHEGLMIHLLTFVYNDLGGGNEPFVRDIILGTSFGYINSASLKIALSATTTTTTTTTTISSSSSSSSSIPHGHTWTWLNLVGVLIATTIGCQEFKNHKDHPQGHQESGGGGGGDKTMTRNNKRKKTLAIFLGEAAVPRAQLAMMMPLWTLVCAWFWRLKVSLAALFLLYSLFVASRVLTQRNAGAEERTWRFWARWTAVVYLFPVVAVLSAD